MLRTVAAIGILSFAGFAQAPARESEEVMKAYRSLVEAMAKCDAATVERLTTRDEVVIGPSGNLFNREEQKTPPDCTPYKPATFSDTRVRIYGGDTAIVTGRIVIRTRAGGDGPEARFTAVFVKEGNAWKSASYQGTTIRTAATPAK